MLIVAFFRTKSVFACITALALFTVVLKTVVCHKKTFTHRFVLFLNTVTDIRDVLTVLGNALLRAVGNDSTCIFDHRYDVIVPTFVCNLL